MKELKIIKYISLKNISIEIKRLKYSKILNMKKYEALEEFPSKLSNLVILEELNFQSVKIWRSCQKGLEAWYVWRYYKCLNVRLWKIFQVDCQNGFIWGLVILKV